MITSIRLSTGKTFSIPVFSALPTGSSPQIVTRGLTIMCDFEYTANGAYLEQQNYTDAEILEIVNILTGSSYTTFDKTLTGYLPDFYGCNSIMYAAWFYNVSNDRYELNISKGNTYGTTLTIPGPGWGYVDTYLNGYCKAGTSDPQFPYDDFYDGVNSTTTPPFPVHNFRQGVYYSLDIYTNGTLQYGNKTGLTESQVRTNINTYIENHPDSGVSYDESPMDFDNPYGIVISEPGGGDGAGTGADIDEIEKMPIPDLPSIDINNCGFITTYYATVGQIKALASFLWSSAFDIDSFKKLFSDPMQCIIGLGIVPVEPVITGSQTVHFGDIDSSVAMNTCAQYAQKDCGSVNIKPYIGSFLDYAPYVNISIYLPYIGIRELSPDDVMNDTVNVTYNIDVLTGGCAAIVSTSKKGVLYQFNGNCITNVPLTSINYSQAIQNAVSAVGSAVGIAAGIATGAAPLTAMGVAGLASNAANTACNTKPTVQRSGSMGGSAGMLSVQTPYLIINRPKLSVPDKLNKYTGNTSNMTMALNTIKGFTMIDYIHLDGISCTDAERNELLSILKEGVIF